MGIVGKIQHTWNAFLNRDPTDDYRYPNYSVQSYRPDRVRFTKGNEKSIVNTIYNRISVDASLIDIEHVQLDDNDRFLSNIDSTLNTCLTVEANKDQTGRAFIQDVVMSLMDEGSIAIVPIDVDIDDDGGERDIESLRTGKILEWAPDQVKVRVYNDRTGLREDIWCWKNQIAIVENPFYSVMNEPNSTIQRLIRKLNLLDIVDEQSSSGKMDLIIQLPYLIRSQAKKDQADERRRAIEEQLMGSKYGIAYTDGTEKITQLNRPVENNLMKQIEYLTNLAFSQLGMTQSILDGTADEKTMLNYQSRTVKPIIVAIVSEMIRKFISVENRMKKQSILFSRDPFALVPLSSLAEIGDKFTRNEILTSNEMRQLIGMKPHKDPKADELSNKNIKQVPGETIKDIKTSSEELIDSNEKIEKEE